MHHATGRTLGSTLVAAAVFISAIMMMGLAFPLVHPSTGASHAAPALATPARPATTHPVSLPAAGNATGGVVITSKIPVYMTLPYLLTWTISVQNATLDSASVQESVAFTYSPGRALVLNKSIDVTAQFATSTPLNGNFEVNATNLASRYAGGLLLEGAWVVTIWLTVTNTSQPTPVPFSTQASFGTQLSAHFPTGKIFNPAAMANVSQGTVTISGEYNGSFVNSANVTVYNSTNAVVFVQGVFTPQANPNAQEGFAVNAVLLPGTYTLVFVLGTPYNHTINAATESFTVLAGTPITYFNQTGGGLSLGGLGPGATAAILVVVGLVVGMIVGLAVTRGTSMKPAGAAQPWASQSTTGANPTNECPVCHQTFGSAGELSDHMKSQHGMTG